jgi:hypothetical protein
VKNFRHFFLLPIAAIAVMFYSCDDSGTNPNAFRQGEISITLTNFRTLNTSVEGSYQLWIAFDTSAVFLRNIGSFNIGAGGQIVDLSGNPMSFQLYADTIYAAFASYCFISVGTDIGNPNNPHLIGGTFAHYNDSVGTHITINDANGVGSALSPVIANGPAWYILAQPSNHNVNCFSGAWFCDALGNPFLPMGILAPGTGWIYEGWVVDTSENPINYHSTGRFYDPNSRDFDGAGACAGTDSSYNKPGQDWVNNFPEGCPGTWNLLSGTIQIFITIEPANEQGSALNSPFFVKLFWQNHIDPTVGCGTRDNLFNQSLYSRLPVGHIHIQR